MKILQNFLKKHIWKIYINHQDKSTKENFNSNNYKLKNKINQVDIIKNNNETFINIYEDELETDFLGIPILDENKSNSTKKIKKKILFKNNN